MSSKNKDNDNVVFGANVRKTRKLLDLTQQNLASMFEISNDYVSRIEKGERSPSPHLKRALENWMDAASGNPPVASSLIYASNAPIAVEGSIVAGGSVTGNQVRGNSPAGNHTLQLSPDETRLISLLREVGGNKVLQKFISELERIEKLIDGED